MSWGRTLLYSNRSSSLVRLTCPMPHADFVAPSFIFYRWLQLHRGNISRKINTAHAIVTWTKIDNVLSSFPSLHCLTYNFTPTGTALLTPFDIRLIDRNLLALHQPHPI